MSDKPTSESIAVKKAWAYEVINAWKSGSFFRKYKDRSNTQAKWDARKEKRALRDSIPEQQNNNKKGARL